MHTADDYFAELEEYLRQMPEAERAEIMTYYREYAQEGGLLDAEQLREHFGPPEVLAARILEDEAGKRTQDAPQRTEETGVRPAAVLAGIMIAVAALGIGAFKFLRPGTAAEPAVTTESALSRDAGTAQPDDGADSSDTQKAGGGALQSYDGTVAPFIDISVDMAAVNIRVETGDTYALRYTLRDDEIVERAGVEGQTLYLVSHKKTNQSSNAGYGEVCITVPAEADLQNLQFSTVSGEVTVPELSCGSVSVDTVAGDLVLDCVVDGNVIVDSTSGSVKFGGQCKELTMNSTSGRLTFTGKAEKVGLDTTSGDMEFTGTAGLMEMDATSGGLTFTGNADEVSLDTASGDMEFTGTADWVEMDSTSGSARVEGTVTEQARIDLISGDILVVAADPTVTAEGRDIDFNGQSVDNDEWDRQGSGCTLILETSSGSISIRNP